MSSFVKPVIVRSSSTSTSIISSSLSNNISSSGHENYSPQLIIRLGREIKNLIQNPPEGITFIPNEESDNITEIYVEIQGPVGTPFEDGIFKMKLILGKDFPHAPPKGFFTTKIFHPNVSPSGEICVNMLKKDWSHTVTLSHVLQVIRCLLIIPFPESSLNDEAGRLFMESYEEYERRAKIMTTVYAINRKLSGSLSDDINGDGSDDGKEGNKIGNSLDNKDGLLGKGGKNSSSSSRNGKNSSTDRKTKIRDKQKDNRKKGLKRL